MDKTSKLLLKFVGLVASVTIDLWLLPLSGSVSDKWFTTWLWSTICALLFTIFFIVWIAETLINWKNK